MRYEENSAFPLVADTLNVQFFAPGLTKREYFAAMALQGLLASCQSFDIIDYADFAYDAILVADFLIEELQS